MTQLTDEQLGFLLHHKIPSSAVFDAAGMQRSDWQAELKRQNKAVAIVDSACKKGRMLRLRISSGHCMQCSPQGIASWKRHQEAAFVYVAASLKLKLIKIGVSKLPSDRADSLSRDGYGGATDWTIIYRRRFNRAGSIEAQAQSSLKGFESPRTYTRLGHGTSITTYELFACDYARARDAVESFAEHALGDMWERHDANVNYDFVDNRL